MLTQGVFEKISKWKQQEAKGDSEVWEKILASEIMKYKRAGPPIKIHTVQTLWDHFFSLQKKIGLTRWEVAFIVITSIDLEYFTHMLIEQSEFMRWFTTDFSGDKAAGTQR